MTTNPNGVALIQGFEQCRLTAYLDSGGVYTIGWGSTGPDVVEGTVWTQAFADMRFLHDIGWAEKCVSHFVTAALTSNQFSALVSFVYNCGYGTFERSAFPTLLDAGKTEAASLLFPLYDTCKGVVSLGLRRRRAAEQALFLTA